MNHSPVSKGSLLDNIPPPGFPDEVFENIIENNHVRIERIVSRGQVSPPGFWYDQNEEEWVMILEGEALLEFQNPSEQIRLLPSQWVMIPAERKHRISYTSDPAIWLAVWFPKNALQPDTELD